MVESGEERGMMMGDESSRKPSASTESCMWWRYGAGVFDGGDEEAKEAFFFRFVACDEVVGGGAERGFGDAAGVPFFCEFAGGVVAADFVGAVPSAG